MPIFSRPKHKNASLNMSRIPYGNYSLLPYQIFPRTKTLANELNEFLQIILEEAPESIDGQNGDLFDNCIENWMNRAKSELAKQRASRAETIRIMVSTREANRQNAKDWIKCDQQQLANLNKKMEELEQIDLKRVNFD